MKLLVHEIRAVLMLSVKNKMELVLADVSPIIMEILIHRADQNA